MNIVDFAKKVLAKEERKALCDGLWCETTCPYGIARPRGDVTCTQETREEWAIQFMSEQDATKISKWRDTTRGGWFVRIYAEDGRGIHPIHGAILIDNTWTVRSWSDEGRFIINQPSSFDLMPPRKHRFKTLEELIEDYYVARFDSFFMIKNKNNEPIGQLDCNLIGTEVTHRGMYSETFWNIVTKEV